MAAIVAVALFVVALIVGSVATSAMLFNAGVQYGRYQAERAALAEQIESAKAEVVRGEALAEQTSKTLATAAAIAAKARAGQQRVQEDYNAYVQANPHPDCHLPADYVRVWNHANSEAHPSTAVDIAARTADRLPGAAAIEQRGAEQPAGQPPGGSRAVPGVRRPPAGVGGVDQGPVEH